MRAIVIALLLAGCGSITPVTSTLVTTDAAADQVADGGAEHAPPVDGDAGRGGSGGGAGGAMGGTGGSVGGSSGAAGAGGAGAGGAAGGAPVCGAPWNQYAISCASSGFPHCVSGCTDSAGAALRGCWADAAHSMFCASSTICADCP